MSGKTMFGQTLLAALCAAGLLSAAGDTRLSDAAMQGNGDVVRSLLKQKVDVDAGQGDGTTALHWAAFRDDLEMVKTLLAAGANVKAATREGAITPLFMACTNGNAAIVEALLKAGAEANSVKVLLEHGADLKAKESAHGQTALMFAAALNRDAAVRVLLTHGADANASS